MAKNFLQLSCLQYHFQIFLITGKVYPKKERKKKKKKSLKKILGEYSSIAGNAIRHAQLFQTCSTVSDILQLQYGESSNPSL